MKDFRTTEDLREYLLGIPQDFTTEFHGPSGSCYSLSWKKNAWIIRVNNKKIGFVTAEDLNADIDIRNPNLILKINSYIRSNNGDLVALKKYLRELKKEDLVNA